MNTGSPAHFKGIAWEHRQLISHARAITWKLVPHASGRYPSSPFWRTSNVVSAGNAPGLAPHSTGRGPDKLFAETTRVSKEARAPGTAHGMGREPAGHVHSSDNSLGAGQWAALHLLSFCTYLTRVLSVTRHEQRICESTELCTFGRLDDSTPDYRLFCHCMSSSLAQMHSRGSTWLMTGCRVLTPCGWWAVCAGRDPSDEEQEVTMCQTSCCATNRHAESSAHMIGAVAGGEQWSPEMPLRDTSSVVREGRLPLTPQSAGSSPVRPELLRFNICSHHTPSDVLQCCQLPSASRPSSSGCSSSCSCSLG